jgi:hypothetical protein
MLPGCERWLRRASSTISDPTPTSFPFGPDQGGAAPGRVRRRGEDRLVQEVFPVARELALGHDLDADRVGAPAGRTDDRRVLLGHVGRGAEHRRLDPKRLDRAHEPEAGLVVVGDRMGLHDASAHRGQRHLVGLRDQIADGEHETLLVDDDAAALPVGAEERSGEGVLRHVRAQRHDRRERLVEIEVEVLGPRTRRGHQRRVQHMEKAARPVAVGAFDLSHG